MNENRFAEARERDIRTVSESLGVVLARNKRKAYCPDHSRGPGKGTPSISFYTRDGAQRFKCHGCQKAGDVVDLVSWLRGCEVNDALEYICGSRLNGTKVTYPEIREAEPDVPTNKRIAACSAFIGALGEIDNFGAIWLLKERGITMESVRGFRITDIHEKKATHAMGAAIRATSVDVCVSLGLAARSNSSDNLFCPVGFAYHLALPYLTDTGSVAHIQFRRVSKSGSDIKGPKYYHLRGSVPLPYNLPTTTSLPRTESGSGRVFLVEGALDAVALSQAGLGALGIPGVGWLDKNRSERILKRLTGTDEVVVAFDSDDAGEKNTDRCAEIFETLGAKTLTVRWPVGFSGDWCDWIKDRPGDAPEVLERATELSETESWIGDIMRDGTEDVVAVAAGNRETNQLKTGYALMDSIMEIEPGDMVVVAARPSTGKSHFVLSLMQRMAHKSGTRSLFISLEMSKISVAKRISAAEMRLGKSQKRSVDDLKEAAAFANKSFSGLPILVDFGTRKLERITEYIRMAVRRHKIEVVVIDYLQLVECKGRSREQEVAQASRDLKGLANELLVPIIVVVQMNREIERRTGNMPQMSDLRESGQIEQDADSILFVDRPFNRDPNANFTDFNVRVAKQRNGSTGKFTMHLPEPFGWLQDREFDNVSESV
jgi:KaiC/GvpD/RAD55 family RecA-like ATPase